MLWRNEKIKILGRNCESKRLLEDLGLVTYLLTYLFTYYME